MSIKFFFSLLQRPDQDEWGSGLDAMQIALSLEKNVNQSLLDLHKTAAAHEDDHVCPTQLNFWQSI